MTESPPCRPQVLRSLADATRALAHTVDTGLRFQARTQGVVAAEPTRPILPRTRAARTRGPGPADARSCSPSRIGQPTGSEVCGRCWTSRRPSTARSWRRVTCREAQENLLARPDPAADAADAATGTPPDDDERMSAVGEHAPPRGRTGAPTAPTEQGAGTVHSVTTGSIGDHRCSGNAPGSHPARVHPRRRPAADLGPRTSDRRNPLTPTASGAKPPRTALSGPCCPRCDEVRRGASVLVTLVTW